MTVIVQVALAATVLQVLVSAKSPPLEPLIVMLLTVKAAVPVFETVMLCPGLVVPSAWLAKDRLGGDRLATAWVPVPVRLTVCVVPAGASSVTVSVPERLPV